MRTARRHLVTSLAFALVASPVSAQTDVRAAVSPSLTPEAAASVFIETVITGCIAAVSKGARLADVAGARVAVSADAETRRQSGASADETVFDVIAGKGVVTAHDKAGRCVVSVYGPAAAPTIMDLARRLADADQGFERLAAAASPTGLGATLYKVAGERRVQVMISGSEPGMPGHRSRFSVVRATVFSTPAG